MELIAAYLRYHKVSNGVAVIYEPRADVFRVALFVDLEDVLRQIVPSFPVPVAVCVVFAGCQDPCMALGQFVDLALLAVGVLNEGFAAVVEFVLPGDEALDERIGQIVRLGAVREKLVTAGMRRR